VCNFDGKTGGVHFLAPVAIVRYVTQFISLGVENGDLMTVLVSGG